MLSTFTTPKRRRGLRGKASREKLPATVPPSPSTPSSLYSHNSTDSRTSTSSFASTHTISEMSVTTMTSYSADSTNLNNCVEEPVAGPSTLAQDVHPHNSKHHNYPPPVQNNTPLSPIEMFKLRLAGGVEGMHARKQSTGSLSGGPVRVVRVAGRGGQGSRPRALPVDPNSSTTPRPLPPRENLRSPLAPSGPATKLPTRIVGRGGVGSRPRGLLVSDPPPQFGMPQNPELPPPPLATAAMIQETPRPQPPAVYRPGGRGGAGSRPRKVKPQPEERDRDRDKDKDFKFPWKGKGKAKADLTANALTRTDTQFSTVSSLAFAPAPTSPRQRELSPQPSIASMDSWDAHLAQRQTNTTNKLTRTLGADFVLPGGSNSASPVRPDYSARRRSGFGSLMQHLQTNSLSSLSSSNSRENQAPDDYRRSPHGSEDIHNPDDSLEGPEHPTDDAYLSDDVSEILSFTPSTDPRFSLSSDSISSGQIHVQPRLDLDSETDSDYARRLTMTPTQFAAYSDSDSRQHTPTPDDKQRFESPFQTMPLFVRPWEPTAADELASQEWSGEWNQRDMQSVIRSLRTLKFSAG
ncbi:hypothetical protein DFH06DRAFT_454028 [Mycena polygramma]|nr:hypothetical protein DFH06DRAFT_454028 [Mycena polygramma]